jgi:hypothetical protein
MNHGAKTFADGLKTLSNLWTIRAPARERLAVNPDATMVKVVSIRAPARERPRSKNSPAEILLFQSALLRGSDPIFMTAVTIVKQRF